VIALRADLPRLIGNRHITHAQRRPPIRPAERAKRPNLLHRLNVQLPKRGIAIQPQSRRQLLQRDVRNCMVHQHFRKAFEMIDGKRKPRSHIVAAPGGEQLRTLRQPRMNGVAVDAAG
jgi:hypothetical protein